MTLLQTKVANELKMDLDKSNIINSTHIEFKKLKMPIKNYQDFYKFYLTEHHDLNCRRLHFIGSTLGVAAFYTAIRKRQKRYIPYGLLAGYGCAWIGHFVFEKNKPASFKQPLYSFISDWRMYGHILTAQLSLTDQAKDRYIP